MSPKSIAIPPNPSARLGQRRAALLRLMREDDAETTPALSPIAARRTPKPGQSAPTHRYHVGERLRMGSGGLSVARAAATCKIVALLPYEGRGQLLYRVRSDTEAFERVVAEADLSRD